MATSLERPDEHEAGAARELYCGLNNVRECNGGCTFFDNRSLQNDEVNPCILINSIKSVAVSLGRLARNTSNSEVSPPPPPSPVRSK